MSRLHLALRLRCHKVLCLTLSSTLFCAGCAVVGIVADKVAPPTVEAQYDPGKTTQLLIIAENYRDPTQSASDAERVARLVGDELTKEEAAFVISPEKLALVRDSRPGAYAKMSVVDLGRAVGAQKVIYIDLGGVGVGAQPGSDVLKGVAHASVKVIDVATSQVVFPQDMADGVQVAFETPMHRATPRATPDAVRSEAIIGLSGKIARLFHQYHPTDLEALDRDL